MSILTARQPNSEAAASSGSSIIRQIAALQRACRGFDLARRLVQAQPGEAVEDQGE